MKRPGLGQTRKGTRMPNLSFECGHPGRNGPLRQKFQFATGGLIGEDVRCHGRLPARVIVRQRTDMESPGQLGMGEPMEASVVSSDVGEGGFLASITRSEAYA